MFTGLVVKPIYKSRQAGKPEKQRFVSCGLEVDGLMDTRFHILRIGAACNTQAVAQARDIESAISRVEALGICTPGRYLIVSEATGNKFYLDADANGTVTMLLAKSHKHTKSALRARAGYSDFRPEES